jgi:hypothetical protein
VGLRPCCGEFATVDLRTRARTAARNRHGLCFERALRQLVEHGANPGRRQHAIHLHRGERAAWHAAVLRLAGVLHESVAAASLDRE